MRNRFTRVIGILVLLLLVAASSGAQTYDFNVTNSVGVVTTGVIEKEPPLYDTMTVFWAGFVLVFGMGLSATGARWVKKLIAGGYEEGD